MDVSYLPSTWLRDSFVQIPKWRYFYEVNRLLYILSDSGRICVLLQHCVIGRAQQLIICVGAAKHSGFLCPSLNPLYIVGHVSPVVTLAVKIIFVEVDYHPFVSKRVGLSSRHWIHWMFLANARLTFPKHTCHSVRGLRLPGVRMVTSGSSRIVLVILLVLLFWPKTFQVAKRLCNISPSWGC